jgi:hypothetical protein
MCWMPTERDTLMDSRRETPKKVERTQELRRSGAAGPHKDKRNKRVTKKTIIEKEQENG